MLIVAIFLIAYALSGGKLPKIPLIEKPEGAKP